MDIQCHSLCMEESNHFLAVPAQLYSMRMDLKLHPMKFLIGEQGQVLLQPIDAKSAFPIAVDIVAKWYSKRIESTDYLHKYAKVCNFLDLTFHNITNTESSLHKEQLRIINSIWFLYW